MKPRGRRRRIDLWSVAVVPLGIGVVLLAQVIDGVAVRSLLHGSAALIVFGGTLGAVMISYSPAEIYDAGRAALRAFLVTEQDTQALTASLVALSVQAHRRGLPALEQEVNAITDPFLRDGLSLAVDNHTAETLLEFMTADKLARDADEEAPARVFEAAAGYAPTLGILGAVLGLIKVMGQLNAPAALGSGIAVAFVATAYGVGSANLVLLPLAGRLRERAALAARRRELIVQGVCAIQQRANPRLVAQRLRTLSVAPPRVDAASPGPPGGSLRARMSS